MNRDTELLKIQILADYYHSKFNLAFSFLITGLIGLTIAVMTIVYEGHLNFLVFYLTLIIIMVAFYSGANSIENRYSENLDILDNLIKQVENSEALPSIKELKKMKREKPKPKK